MEPRFTFFPAKPKAGPPRSNGGRNNSIRPERILDLGRRSYAEVRDLQLKKHAAVALRDEEEVILLTEHDSVYTCGRSTKKEERPVNAPIPVIDIERGGGLTYHGPGQIVGYPILNLAKRRLSIPQYLRLIEKSLMEILLQLGVAAHYKEEYRAGLWVGKKKVVSIGIAVRRWVTFHGFALNVDCDLNYFKNVHPCGLQGDQVTSLQELGLQVDKEELKKTIGKKLTSLFFITTSS